MRLRSDYMNENPESMQPPSDGWWVQSDEDWVLTNIICKCLHGDQDADDSDWPGVVKEEDDEDPATLEEVPGSLEGSAKEPK